MEITYNQFVCALMESEVPTEKRTYKNIPKYSTGKNKVPFQQWLGLKGNGSKAYDGKFYGWSHRAIYGFGVGDTVKGNSMAHKSYQWEDDETGTKHDPYVIKTEKEAKEHAVRFARAVS